MKLYRMLGGISKILPVAWSATRCKTKNVSGDQIPRPTEQNDIDRRISAMSDKNTGK